MDASKNGHTGAEPERGGTSPRHEDELPMGWRWSIPRVLGILAFLAMVIFWIWAFANRDSIAHPDEFDDPVFVASAEAVCAERQATITDLPLATAVDDVFERAELLGLGTEQLEAMVAELASIEPPTDPKGADGVVRWLADYDLYLSDRRDYQDVLASGNDDPFLLSPNDDGARVSDLLTTFAEVNNMASCAPSGDV